MFSSGQKKIIIMFVVYIMVLILLWIAVNFFLIERIKKLSEQYLSGQEEFLSLGQKEGLIKTLESDFQDKESKLTSINSAFFSSEKEAVGFIYDLEKIADLTNSKIDIQAEQAVVDTKALSSESSEKNETAKPADNQEKKTEENKAINFKVSLVGTFSSAIEFIANLENTPFPPYRLVEISDLAISKATGSNEVNTVFKVKVYIK